MCFRTHFYNVAVRRGGGDRGSVMDDGDPITDRVRLGVQFFEECGHDRSQIVHQDFAFRKDQDFGVLCGPW
jgi:hypothetical protein